MNLQDTLEPLIVVESSGESINDVWDRVLKIVIVAGMAALAYSSLSGHGFARIFSNVRTHRLYLLIEKPSVIWAFLGTLLLSFRTLLWFLYRPQPLQDSESAPHLTVIIPAYNEGPMVRNSIESVATANYPPGKLEIFVVDDGSKDDTWIHIEKAAALYPNLVRTIRFEKNRGKRAGLEAGFRLGKGEVAITIDSDSVIEKNTLLAMVGPFRDPSVGAVAGNVRILNKRSGLIPRMLHVYFIYLCDLLRAMQSGYGMVYCCPGALAAYRMSSVRQVLDKWMNQRFLGAPCSYGEDRAMTPYILGLGEKTLYQRTAVVHTVMPRTYSKLCKMYIRWDRSYIREQFHLASVIPRRRGWPRLISAVDFVLTNFKFPLSFGVLALFVVAVAHEPFTLVRMLVAVGVLAGFNMLFYLRAERSWNCIYGVLYGYFAFFGLFWVFPYALLTLRSRSWMTR